MGNILSITSDKGNNALNNNKIYKKNLLMLEFDQEWTNGLSTMYVHFFVLTLLSV